MWLSLFTSMLICTRNIEANKKPHVCVQHGGSADSTVALKHWVPTKDNMYVLPIFVGKKIKIGECGILIVTGTNVNN